MQRGITIVLGVALVGAVALLLVSRRGQQNLQSPPSETSLASTPSASPNLAAAAGVSSALASDGDETPDVGPTVAGDFSHLPDGGPIPRLPDSAPKEVSFGVILIAYQGAEFAPKGARTRAQALKHAEELAVRAKADFTEAAKLGDHGSSANAGQIPRGILEPAIEYALFSLAEGQVRETPLDTPRGYWVLKRNK